MAFGASAARRRVVVMVCRAMNEEQEWRFGFGGGGRRRSASPFVCASTQGDARELRSFQKFPGIISHFSREIGSKISLQPESGR